MVKARSEKIQRKGQVSFGKQTEMHLKHYDNAANRTLYYCLINVDEFPSVWSYAEQMVAESLQRTQVMLAAPEKLSQRLQPFIYTPEAFAARMEIFDQQRHVSPINFDEPLSKAQLQYLLKQCAPSALIDGCWLQNISLAASNHMDVVTRLFHVYSKKIGNGETSKHDGNRYKEMLRRAEIHFPEVNSRLFTAQTVLDEAAFTVPVFQLALSLFPRTRLPELIGFTLGHFYGSLDRLLSALQDDIKCYGWYDRYCQRYNFSENPHQKSLFMQDVVISYLERFEDESERQNQWQRIWCGLAVDTVISEPWIQGLQNTVMVKALTPHQKMRAMVSDKAPYARNMHRHQKLGQHLINDWFAQEPFDAEGFLQALAASPYINRGEPAKSLLLARSIQFGGSMFRIFTTAEQAVMSEWVDSLVFDSPIDEQDKTSAANPTDSATCQAITSPFESTQKNNDATLDLATYDKCNKRELYYYLVNADLYPDVLSTAYTLAQQYFKRAKASLDKRRLPEQSCLFPYSYEAFEARIHHIYTIESGAYENFEPPSTVPREIMVWFIQQYAPFPMVDGSWVQHIAKAGTSHTEISARLFRIYSDEVGNSNILYNHPNIYRRLLEGEGIHMPPTDSWDFAMQPALRDFAFDLPLLTLSVSMFPKAFLPEIIGVNLAIELSGLGKGYMEIIDELRYWKVDPYFFTLHLTIDNIASGHTAVAMETVHLYLDQILNIQGQQAMQDEWERIWVGYLAFKQSMTQFDSTLERQAGFKYFWPLVRQNIMHRKERKIKQRRATVRAG